MIKKELIQNGKKRMSQYLGLRQKDILETFDISSVYLSEIEGVKKNSGIEMFNKLGNNSKGQFLWRMQQG